MHGNGLSLSRALMPVGEGERHDSSRSAIQSDGSGRVEAVKVLQTDDRFRDQRLRQ